MISYAVKITINHNKTKNTPPKNNNKNKQPTFLQKYVENLFLLLLLA